MELALARRTEKISGICSTCNHVNDCLHRITNGQVIWHCEQFDDFVPVQSKFTVSPLKAAAENIATENYKGLCVNCEHRDSCTHALTPGGIWHCEEYK